MMAQNSTKTARKRGPGRPFQKGKSGNPGGRPKIDPEFRERARKIVDEVVIERWAREVKTGGKSWVRCSELLVSYGYGKPTQAHDVSVMTLVDIINAIPEVDDDSEPTVTLRDTTS